jgi:hypothetical protein
MLTNVLKRQDTWAGILFLTIGAGALLIGRNYPIGSASVMGPGYFPRLLGGLLCVFGLIIAAKGVFKSGLSVDVGSARPFLIILAVVLFGVLLPSAGLIPAIVALVIVGAAGGHEFRLVEALIMAAVLCAFSIAVFNWGLGLHMPLWRAW